MPRRSANGGYWRDIYDRKGSDGAVLLFSFRDSDDTTESTAKAIAGFRARAMREILEDDEP